MNAIEIITADRRALKKTVARVLAGDSKAADAIIDIVRARRRAWAFEDWVAELRKLEATETTVAEWLKENAHG